MLTFTFSWLPYLAVAWLYMKLGDDTWESFRTALLWLLVARMFFSIIELLGGIAAWRIYGKRALTDIYLEVLRSNHFPPRKYSHDDFLAYLTRVEDEDYGGYEISSETRKAATEFRSALTVHESTGLLAGMRHSSAVEAALEIYSPKSKAPDWGEEWGEVEAEADSAH